jgi:hypothetical protein
MHIRTSAAPGAAALIVGWLGMAHAQAYGGTRNDPCSASAQPAASPFGMLVNAIVQQQRERACVQERQAQWAQYNARQKAAKDAAAADAAQAKARQAEADRAKTQAQEKARAEQAAASARASRKKSALRELARADERRAEETRRLRAVALMQAESSPENHCRDPHLAKAVMDGWNGLDAMKQAGVRTIDIEHFTTISFQAESMSFSCHGVFVTNKGWKIAGTVSVRKNIANEAMFVWERDSNQDLSIYDALPPPGASSPEMASQTKVGAQPAVLTQVNTEPVAP